MNETRNHVNAASLAGGVLLIAFGIVLLLGQFHVTDIGSLIRTYWPVIVMAVAVPKLFDYPTFWSGLWLLAVGCWLQAVTLHLWGFTYRNSWPLLLIVLGGGIVLRTIVESLTARGRMVGGEDGHGP